MIDQKLIESIKNCLSSGKSKEDIYLELLKQGYKVDMINDCFYAAFAKEEKGDLSGRTIRIIVTIGAVCIAAGVFSFIAANWDAMNKPVKILIIISSMLFAYRCGWVLSEKYKSRKAAEALILLGTIIYGAGIFLIAQMFNVRGNWPDGFILWMIGAIAMGFAVESYVSFTLALILGISAVFGYPVGIFADSDWFNPFLMSSTVLLFISAVITFITGVIIRKKMDPEHKKYY